MRIRERAALLVLIGTVTWCGAGEVGSAGPSGGLLATAAQAAPFLAPSTFTAFMYARRTALILDW